MHDDDVVILMKKLDEIIALLETLAAKAAIDLMTSADIDTSDAKKVAQMIIDAGIV